MAALADRQIGVVSRLQLIALGMGERAIEHRLATGRLRVIHRGVYAVGHRVLRIEGHWMAAVLAAGDGAVLSHRSAAALWDLRGTERGRIEVIAPTRRRSTRRIQVHSAVLAADEVTIHRGIPVTTPARTVLDLAAVSTRPAVARAVERMDLRGPAAGPPLPALLERYPTRPGAPTVRSVLEEHSAGRGFTRSDLEAWFREACRRGGLPPPRLNVEMRVGSRKIEADAVWDDHRVMVESDGWDTHRTRTAFESDRRRDRELAAQGWRVVRVTWRQLRDEPEPVIRDLRTLLLDDSM